MTEAHSRRAGAFVFVLGAMIVAGVAVGRGDRQAGKLVSAHERRTMPPVELRQLNGGTWRLADHRGRVVIINYWATWCGPCLQEVPALMRLNEEMRSSPVDAVGVSMDQGDPGQVERRVRRFVEALRVSYPIALQAPMSQMEFGMEALPTTILIDQAGRVAKTYVGAAREEDLRKDVGVLLSEQALVRYPLDAPGSPK